VQSLQSRWSNGCSVHKDACIQKTTSMLTGLSASFTCFISTYQADFTSEKLARATKASPPDTNCSFLRSGSARCRHRLYFVQAQGEENGMLLLLQELQRPNIRKASRLHRAYKNPMSDPRLSRSMCLTCHFHQIAQARTARSACNRQ
jgi:hypothetical protein